MQQSNTVLEKVGITNNVVEDWKKMGLKITYPMQENSHYYKSQDGSIFVEAADKYVPPLSQEEVETYTQNPEKFKDDFLQQVNFYFKFHTFLYKKSLYNQQLNSDEEKIATSLALMYLFLSAMDHHYYHYDRYLVYQDYPDTPVGYWWQKLGNYFYEVFKEKVTRELLPTNFLKLLSQDAEILKECKNNLDKIKFKDFKRTLEVIKIFEEAQQKEIKIVSGYPEKEDLLLKSGFGLWNNICDEIKNNPDVIQEKDRKRILQLINGHTITSTRELLLPMQLKTFKEKILELFQEEINRWID